MTRKIVYVNPAHGNEPYILGALIAKQLERGLVERRNDMAVVIPNIYGDRQERILEPYDLSDNFILDGSLGELYKDILFSNGDFSRHMEDVISNRHRVESEARTYLINNYGRVDLEINTGSTFTSEGPVYYAFPMTLFELLQRVVNETELEGVFTRDKLEVCLEEMWGMNSRYQKIFIPSYHTFSFDGDRSPLPNEIPTPPLKPVPEKSAYPIPENSVYCMLSGTGSEIKNMLERARNLQASGYHILISPWVSPDTDTAEFQKADPRVIPNERVIKVFGRAGWGTIWTCQQADKDFEPAPYTPGDDPEIFYNTKTLQTKPLREATDEQRARFGNTMDGISFVADQIMDDLFS